MSILLDTNILARLAQKDHPQHIESVKAVDILRRASEKLFIVPQTLFEFWVICTRPVQPNNGLGFTTSDTAKQIDRARGLFTLALDKAELYEEWERLVRKYDVKGKNAHDARLAAAMNLHGISAILTFNQSDFDRFVEIQVLTPTKVIAEAK